MGLELSSPYPNAKSAGHSADFSLSASFVSLRALEQAVIDSLLTHVLTRENLQPLAREIARTVVERNQDVDIRITTIENQLEEVQGSLNNLVDAIERMGYAADIQRRYDQRKGEEARLLAELSTLKSTRVAPSKIVGVSDAALDQWIEYIRAALEGGDRGVARRALRQFVEKIVVKNETGTLCYSFPLEDDLYMPSVRNLDLTGSGANLIYSPFSGYSGTDSFTFTATDSQGQTLNNTIQLFVDIPVPANIFVNTTAQESPFVTNGNCTLSEAIEAANTNAAVDGCAAGSPMTTDVIDLMPGIYDLSTFAVESGDDRTALPLIRSDILIKGNQSTIQRQNGAYTSGLYQGYGINNCFVQNGATSVYRSNNPGENHFSYFANNWWGAADGPSGAGSGSGDSINEFVGYTPFLTTPPDCCASIPIGVQAEGEPYP